MDVRQEAIAEAAVKLAAELPLATTRMICGWIGTAADFESARRLIGQLSHPHYRGLTLAFIDLCIASVVSASPGEVALALLTAAHAIEAHRDEQQVELVWTGPDAEAVPIRRTEQAILQVLDSACQRITLVSYAVHQIPRIREALVQAARRGVAIRIIVETPDRMEGQSEYSTLKALGDAVASCASVYFWPREKRWKSGSGKIGILHVKCAVADGRWLFVSSANLTEYAFDINMELGLLVTGGTRPAEVEQQFAALIARGVLQRV